MLSKHARNGSETRKVIDRRTSFSNDAAQIGEASVLITGDANKFLWWSVEAIWDLLSRRHSHNVSDNDLHRVLGMPSPSPDVERAKFNARFMPHNHRTVSVCRVDFWAWSPLKPAYTSKGVIKCSQCHRRKAKRALNVFLLLEANIASCFYDIAWAFLCCYIELFFHSIDLVVLEAAVVA